MHTQLIDFYLLKCYKCRREDSNLHPVNPDQTLNLARLPIPPLRQVRGIVRGSIRTPS
jgi:hypothetical protein